MIKGRYLLSTLTVLFFTQAPALAQCPPVIDADTNDTFLGQYLERAGDLNGDGFDDILTNADGNPGTGGNTNYIRAISGKDGSTIYKLLPLNTDSALGDGRARFTVIDDITGDGVADIAAGDPNPGDYDDAGTGHVVIYSGVDGAPAYYVTGDQAGESFGDKVVSVDDVNGDGVRDVLVSAPDFDSPSSDEDGRVVVYSGATFDALYEVTPELLEVYNAYDVFHFASEVASAGDVNGDGRGDFLLGDWLGGLLSTDESEGVVAIVSGATGEIINILTGTGEDYLGTDLSTAGDINGDGFDDIIIGAMETEQDSISGNVGAVYVVSGQSLVTGDIDVLFTFYGDNDEGDFGWSVDGGKDVNGDGVPDVAIGAKAAGYAYVYSGSNGAKIFSLESPLSSSYGYDISLFGDGNGDGYTDIAVGSLYASEFEINYLSNDSNQDGQADICQQDGDNSNEEQTPPSDDGAPDIHPFTSEYAQYYETAWVALGDSLSKLKIAKKKSPKKKKIKKATGKKKKKLKKKKKKIKKARKQIRKNMQEAVAAMNNVPESFQEQFETTHWTTSDLNKILSLVNLTISKKMSTALESTTWKAVQKVLYDLMAEPGEDSQTPPLEDAPPATIDDNTGDSNGSQYTCHASGSYDTCFDYTSPYCHSNWVSGWGYGSTEEQARENAKKSCKAETVRFVNCIVVYCS